MDEVNHEKKCQPAIRVDQNAFAGCFWFFAWLFTIGYLHLHFWRGLLALVIWPYYIGAHVSTMIR